MSERLAFSDFKLARFTFEIRYEPAYLLWDNAGHIWNDANKTWPELKLQSSEPNKTFFKLGSNILLSVELEKAFIIFHHQKVKTAFPILENFLSLLRNHLNIESYSRIGFRPLYNKSFDTKKEAAEAFLKFNRLRVPESKIFNIDGELTQPIFQFTLENEDIGIRFCIKTTSNKINMDVPPELSGIMEPKNIEQDHIEIDIDYYTITSTKPGQFNVSEWVTQIDHVIRRDLKSFIGD